MKGKKNNMEIAIYPDQSGKECFSEKWAEFLTKKNIEVKWVDLTAEDVLKQVEGCDGLMWRTIHPPKDKQLAKRILYIVEKYMDIPVFPDYNTYWHYDDKIAQYYLLKSLGIPIPETWVFWNKDKALKWAEHTEYPKVFKLATGAGSSNVIKVYSQEEASFLIETMFSKGIFPMTLNEYKPKILPQNMYQLKSFFYRIKHGFFYSLKSLYPPLPPTWWQPEKDYILFQEFIPENQYDTRITVIGNRAFGFIRFNRDNDFRASGSGKIDANPHKIGAECVKISFSISEKLKFQCMAIDFLYKKNSPVVCEMSYAFVGQGIKSCTGFWNKELEWINGSMLPEEAQVDSFIEYIKNDKRIK